MCVVGVRCRVLKDQLCVRQIAAGVRSAGVVLTRVCLSLLMYLTDAVEVAPIPAIAAGAGEEAAGGGTGGGTSLRSTLSLRV